MQNFIMHCIEAVEGMVAFAIECHHYLLFSYVLVFYNELDFTDPHCEGLKDCHKVTQI
jgi:hypothetical protein